MKVDRVTNKVNVLRVQPDSKVKHRILVQYTLSAAQLLNLPNGTTSENHSLVEHDSFR